ncbi:MAG TPA: intradiol ring-cleavage dioxygenase [Nitrososphaeraceae archaeon]|nr:intradiol ring-cleavage dioxygenase [Nitrososphaeraceae archaeon]
MNHITIIKNKRIIVIAIALSLHALTVLTAAEEEEGGGGELASNLASAQSITSNQGMASPPPGPFPGQFGPPSPELSATQISASTNQTCTLTPSLIEEEGTPQQIEGPYFVDDMPNRSDIRSDPSDGSVQQGIPLHLVLHVYDVDKGSCIPLSGAQVDIWHANSQGVYSGVQDAGTGGMMYLRGYQLTDDNGTVRFTTVYPGWYEGRAIHIHAKVRTFEGSEKTLEWTSQFYLNNSINEQVHTQPPYSKHGLPEVTNEGDMIYKGASSDGLVQSNTGERLMLNLTKDDDEQSYLGMFNIVLNSGQSRQ